MEHSQNILNILKEKNVTAYRISKDTGISVSLFSKWKSKSTSDISSSNLTKIADYLDCSVDYLLGRTDNPNIYSNQDTKSIPNNVVNLGNSNNPIITNNNESSLSNEHQNELIRIYNSLSTRKQIELMSLAYQMEDEINNSKEVINKNDTEEEKTESLHLAAYGGDGVEVRYYTKEQAKKAEEIAKKLKSKFNN